MKKTRFIQICEYLSRIVQRKEQVPEEMISEYISELAKIAQKRTKKQDFSYYELENRCRMYQTYQMEERERFAYMLGNIMGASYLYRQIGLEMDLKTFEEKVLSPASIQFSVLEIISENPGISRKELYEKIPGDRTSSALSHLTGLLKRGHYIIAQKVGQEKHFFATPRGDEFVHAVHRQNESQAEQESAALESNFIGRRTPIFCYRAEEDNYSPYLSSDILREHRLGISAPDDISDALNDLKQYNYI